MNKNQRQEARRVAEREMPGLVALIGAVSGPEDLAERHDDYIRERMRERFADADPVAGLSWRSRLERGSRDYPFGAKGVI